MTHASWNSSQYDSTPGTHKAIEAALQVKGVSRSFGGSHSACAPYKYQRYSLTRRLGLLSSSVSDNTAIKVISSGASDSAITGATNDHVHSSNSKSAAVRLFTGGPTAGWASVSLHAVDDSSPLSCSLMQVARKSFIAVHTARRIMGIPKYSVATRAPRARPTPIHVAAEMWER